MSKRYNAQNKCVQPGCQHVAELSVLVLVSTMGTRAERMQHSSGACRLCPTCVQALAAGKVPAKLQAGISSAVDKLAADYFRGRQAKP